MKIKFTLILVIVVFIFSMASLSFADTNGDLQTVVKGNSNFGFDLYQELKGEKGNLFFSPYSISTALAMTYAGAKGRTEKEIAEVLHFSLSQGPLHASFSNLQSKLNAIQNKGYIRLSIANSLWAQEGYHFLDTFFDITKKYYGAGLNFVDFEKETEAARITINTWVESETQQKIKELIKPGTIDLLTRLVLCNAIYFKGNWLSQFDKKRTMESDFYVSPDKRIKVSMMNKKSYFKFRDFNDFRAIELPYEGNDLSMIIFLPEKVDGLADLERSLTNDNVKEWMGELLNSYESEILVSLPKFKITCEFELADVLAKMGMPSAFSLPPADFSGMIGKRDFFISNVIHKAFVDVNEEGTEAAAATAVAMIECISKILLFQADHPFVFLIRENQTGSILFIGRIADPTK
ncbi:MAG: serpin family protein [Candidatus Aureabacteria bacterium]|nr:serpin family protein [Candidatus Auribacterota bacterium]MCK5161263.1 serpin family protein [Candidatus Auribacterota bacterium]